MFDVYKKKIENKKNDGNQEKKTAFSTKNKQTNKQAEKKGVVKINEKHSMMLKDSNCVLYI
jgi:hypothetical protein